MTSSYHTWIILSLFIWMIFWYAITLGKTICNMCMKCLNCCASISCRWKKRSPLKKNCLILGIHSGYPRCAPKYLEGEVFGAMAITLKHAWPRKFHGGHQFLQKIYLPLLTTRLTSTLVVTSSNFFMDSRGWASFCEIVFSPCSKIVGHESTLWIETDASQFIIGVVLKQEGHLISYHFETLT